ncbi:Plastidal glycolate/glycerate translocator 1, chloroplastic [Porphyridium purpureum]|uniref:Plastidal glycolate/glycerate translocator 1, chloroplastic n=1 Tax=Porphyridium purpureum TaxID=35688 RepID=A0A5J4YR01_PORPP|nr:Plastidal glycolate/glycerate translocator 1, chloroplastic [Porphyridium purpureum]|eukprot:POR6958..scf236_6
MSAVQVEQAARGVVGALGGISVLLELLVRKDVLGRLRAAKTDGSRSAANGAERVNGVEEAARGERRSLGLTGAQWRALVDLVKSQLGRGIKAVVLIAVLRFVELKLSALLVKIKFPGALAGMVLLSIILMLLEPLFGAYGLCVAKDVRLWATPGSEFLTKWMPLFFAPALVTLPGAVRALLDSGAGKSLLPSLIVVLLGFVGTLVSTANVTKLVCKPSSTGRTVGSASSAAGAAKTAAAPGAKQAAPASFKIDYDAVVLVLVGAATLISACLKKRAAPLLISFTALSFIWGTRLPAGIKSSLHPVVVCGALSSLLLNLLPVSGGTFAQRNALYVQKAGYYFSALLGPSLFALAFKMYDARKLLFANVGVLSSAAVWTSVSALFGTAVIARLLRISPKLAGALLPRTATTPLGLAMSKILGVDESIAVCAIVLSGILGANFGKQMLNALGFRRERWGIVRGTSMGASAHGLGTAALTADGENEAASAAAVTLVLSGALQTILVSVPAIRKALLTIIVAAKAERDKVEGGRGTGLHLLASCRHDRRFETGRRSLSYRAPSIQQNW